MNGISAGVQFRRILSTLRPYFITGILIEGLILVLAAVLRLWSLDLKPPHFDEGINGWFVDQMRANGCYRYDPENYHGPFYFYLLFVFLSLFGRNLWALRLPTVLAGIASVWFTLRFDRYFGTLAARFAALAFAVSPAAVFYGRYAIHESWLFLALLLTTWGVLGLWKKGDRFGLIVTTTGVTLMFLTKETSVIHLVCFLAAAVTLWVCQRFIPSQPGMLLARPSWSWLDLSWCCGLFLFTLVFFYSGTFLNWPGVPDFFAAYAKWFHTGTGEGGHIKADYQIGPINYYWLALMVRYEWPALLGLLYAGRLAWPSPAMMRYVAIYGVGVLAAYSIIPYKTPWCIISILLPFFLLFGCAAQEAWKLVRFHIPVAAVVSVVLGVSLLMTLRLNFLHFTDPKEPYVYVQTMTEISRVTAPVLAAAHHDPRQYAMSGQIILDSYYPLPWIFGDFTRIGYHDKMPDALDGEFIVALASRKKAVEDRLKEPYFRRTFHLRDSMDECMVWFKERSFGEWFANPSHGAVERFAPSHP